MEFFLHGSYRYVLDKYILLYMPQGLEFSSCNTSNCLKTQSLPFLQDLVFLSCADENIHHPGYDAM